MIACGPGDVTDADRQALDEFGHVLAHGGNPATAKTPGWRFRAHPNHFPQFERTETEAYVPSCCCGDTGPNTSDIVESAAWFSTHLDDLTDRQRKAT